MISTKKTLLLCVLSFIFVFNARYSFVESADIDEINTMLKKEKVELNKLREGISKQTRILNKMGKKEYSNLKKQKILDGQLKIRERELKIYDWNLKINLSYAITLSKYLDLLSRSAKSSDENSILTGKSFPSL